MSDHTQGNRAPSTFDAQQLVTLRIRLQGSVFIPGDEGYDQARQTWDVKTFDMRQHGQVEDVMLKAVPHSWG